jgi:hypothetical protein
MLGVRRVEVENMAVVKASQAVAQGNALRKGREGDWRVGVKPLRLAGNHGDAAGIPAESLNGAAGIPAESLN